MKNALLISIGFHLIVTIVWVRVVRIVPVLFVPRQVYSVQLLSVQEVDKILKKPEPVERPAPRPEPQEQKEQELVAPREKKPKPKPQKKIIPSTRIEQAEAAPDTVRADSLEARVTGDIVLDVEEFPFVYYLMTIKRKIASLWRAPGVSHGDPVACRIYFRVQRGGAVAGASVETSSGNYLFDQTALRSVVNASPLPPLPNGFQDDYLGVHFSFVLEEQ